MHDTPGGSPLNHDGAAATASFWHGADDGSLQCDLCPHACRLLRDGQRGACFVRRRHRGRMESTVFGQVAASFVDPIEKKPLNHFYPGTSVLSVGTAGCNLACRFCQNAGLSQSRQPLPRRQVVEPGAIAAAALQLGCKSVAFTYNDPVVFAEYAIATATACQALGIKTVAVTAGYIREPARRAFFGHIDAANVDLKAFSDDFYRRMTGGRLQPVLDTLVWLRRERSVWLEITTLLIAGQNDSDAELAALSQWVARELGPETPIHFSAFMPCHQLTGIAATAPATLLRARDIALQAGVHHVYTGNIHHREGDTTFCPSCRRPLIVRDWFQLGAYHLDPDGACRYCGEPIAGRFDSGPGGFGRQQIPVRFTP